MAKQIWGMSLYKAPKDLVERKLFPLHKMDKNMAEPYPV